MQLGVISQAWVCLIGEIAQSAPLRKEGAAAPLVALAGLGMPVKMHASQISPVQGMDIALETVMNANAWIHGQVQDALCALRNSMGKFVNRGAHLMLIARVTGIVTVSVACAYAWMVG